ncbi:MAG: formyltransferase family protein, partial [Patescibacteria group bacterium]
MKIAMLISGGGTTASAIINACKSGQLKNIKPVLVVASKDGVDGVKRTVDAGMDAKDVVVINPRNFVSPNKFGKAIIKACEARGVEFVGQYGWLALTPENVIHRFVGMMTNQHPGPLDPGRPDFGGSGMYGKRVHAACLCFARKTGRSWWSEATAQRVAVNFDEGAVLKRRQVPILPDDDVNALAARMLPIE